MELIRAFCGYSLAACAALLLLPEGSLRKTAALSFGLMTSLLWMDGLLQTELPDIHFTGAYSPLTHSGTALDERSVYEDLLTSAASAAAGSTVYVTLHDDNLVFSSSEADETAIQQAADALGLKKEDLTSVYTR